MQDPRRIDFNLVMSRKGANDKLDTLHDEIEACDYVCLTDAISNTGNGGELAMEHLGKDAADAMQFGEQKKYRLQVLKDEWGNTPQPGDTVKRITHKPWRDRQGRKLRSSAISAMKRRGDYKAKYEIVREYTIDEKGCVEMPFEDAGHFLTEYGVHFETGYALTGRKELSGGPCKAPNGSMMHVHYWRYQEAPPWVYSQLSKIETKKGKLKRGRKEPKKEEPKKEEPKIDTSAEQ
jgi:hypothetical protein